MLNGARYILKHIKKKHICEIEIHFTSKDDNAYISPSIHQKRLAKHLDIRIFYIATGPGAEHGHPQNDHLPRLTAAGHSILVWSNSGSNASSGGMKIFCTFAAPAILLKYFFHLRASGQVALTSLLGDFSCLPEKIF